MLIMFENNGTIYLTFYTKYFHVLKKGRYNVTVHGLRVTFVYILYGQVLLL